MSVVFTFISNERSNERDPKINGTNELETFRAEVQAFLKESLTPDLIAARRYMTSVYCDYETGLAWQRKLYDKGWLVPSWPKEYGGTGWTLSQRHVFETELARAGAPPVSPMGIGMLGPALLGYGTEEQKNYYLPRMLKGVDFWCQGYSEWQAGSDLAALNLKAESDGDHYILNGSKTWTTHAHYANRMFCLVRTGAFERPQRGVSFLLVDLNLNGVTARPIRFFSQDYEQCEVVFENVRVPKTALVGQEHEGWAVTKYLLEFERGSKPSAPRLYQQLERVGHLIEGGANHRRAAELKTRVDGIDAMELNYLNQIEQTGSPGPGSSVLKVQSTELSQEISAFAMEVAAYYGLPYQPEAISRRDATNAVGPEEFLTIAPFYFNNRAASIYAGSNEIQRNIIAKAVLGL